MSLERLVKYSKLNRVQQDAVRMRVEGEKIEVISIALNKPAPTLNDWLCPWRGKLMEELEEYKAYLVSKQMETTEEFQKKIAMDAERLWDELKSIALSDDDEMPKHVKLGALDSALDRIGIARVSKTEGKIGISVTDADRKRRFEEIAELQKDLAPVQVARLMGKVG